ncbi:hypothetical protein L1049_024679 [Liquidambar formosana]|uniref:F-box domain-containing protein n=1 Tax=Liquidambar formosana TaxID=63359 RepID=A0AAP0S2E0_LIQFO
MATTLRDMPGDMVTNILLQLPVKSLMRFRCVCKSWHALISDPNFINTHLNQTRVNNKGYVLIKHRDSDLDKFSLRCDETFVGQKRLELPFKENVESLMVEGYCNGLLCLSCLGNPRIQRDLYLWNPAIQKLKRLPQSTPITERFACIYFAFGHVPQIDDYRVVKFVYHRYIPCVNGICNAALRCLKAPPEAELYSLRTNSWKAIENVFPCVIQSCSKDPILNGIVHWLARVYQEGGPFYEFVLSFDMGNEIFGEILFESSQSVAVMIMY